MPTNNCICKYKHVQEFKNVQFSIDINNKTLKVKRVNKIIIKNSKNAVMPGAVHTHTHRYSYLNNRAEILSALKVMGKKGKPKTLV